MKNIEPEYILMILCAGLGLTMGAIATLSYWAGQPTPKAINALFNLSMPMACFALSMIFAVLTGSLIKDFNEWLHK